ncbi:MAG: hypothetical protein RL161_767 [Bacteroidota bacterium]|jgi:hypothetical protein
MKALRFFSWCVLTALASATILWVGANWMQFPVPSHWTGILVFYVFFTFLTFLLLPPGLPPMVFSSRYLLFLVMRLGAALILMVISAFMDSSRVVANTLFNLLNYIVFLILEVLVLFQGLNSLKKG